MMTLACLSLPNNSTFYYFHTQGQNKPKALVALRKCAYCMIVGTDKVCALSCSDPGLI